MIPRGYLYVIGCASSFGLITTLAKLTYDEGASPQTVVFFRILTGSLLMGVWSTYSHRNNLKYVIRKSLQRTNLPIVLLIIAIGFCIAGMSLGYLGSVKYIPVSLSVLLFFTFPFWVLLLNFIIHGIVVSWLKLFAFVLAFSGLALSLGPTWEVLDWRGIALVLGGSIFSVSLRWRKETPKFTTVAIAGLFCCLFSFVIIVQNDLDFLSSSKNESLFALHGTLVCLGLILYSIGSRVIPAAELTLLSLTEVIGGIFWVWIPILGINEIPSNNTIIGGFLIFMAIIYYSLVIKNNRRFIGLT